MFVVSSSGFRAHALRSLLAGGCVGVMAALAASGGIALTLIPFTASLVVLATMPDNPAARLKAVIGGHLICSIVGLITLKLLGLGPSTLAVAVGEDPGTVEEVCEPFLVRAGMLARTPRGRVATAAAWAHLGVSPPPDVPGSAPPALF